MPLAQPHTQWQTPDADGDVLITPDATQLRGQWAAIAALSDEKRFGKLSARDLRTLTRFWLAAKADIDPETSIVATGHQCEFHHCGVWFKDLLISQLAGEFDAAAIHFAADLDTPSHRNIDVPIADGDELSLRTVNFLDAPDGHVPAFIPAPGAKVLSELDSAASAAGLDGKLYWLWRSAAAACDGSLADWFIAGREAVNTSLGLDIATVAMSDLVRSEPYAHFASAIIVGGQRLSSLHARLLGEHRRKFNIRSASRPVADLIKNSDGRLELPLWVQKPGCPRQRLFAAYHSDAVELFGDSQQIAACDLNHATIAECVSQLGESAECVLLSPRALTLTMFLRLFACDIFVHGTGGARYDLLGDVLTQSFFGISPPPHITATATKRLNLPRRSGSPEDLAAAKSRLHHWRHNPTAASDDNADAAERLAKLPKQIQAASRLSSQRRELFKAMHKLKAELRQKSSQREAEIIADIARLKVDIQHNKIAGNREYFFALFDRKSLEQLHEPLRQWLAAGQ